MALFKILRGNKSKIGTSATPFHDGYAYLTPDDGGFYIDATHDGKNERIHINPQSRSFTATLTASGWSNGSQTITVTGIAADSNGNVGLSASANNTAIAAASEAQLCVTAQAANSLTITARGVVPTCDIPVTIILSE